MTVSDVSYGTRSSPGNGGITVMRLPELPRSLVIVGGGYIAAEFAHVFASFGVRVTIVGRSPRLLSREDEQVSERFTQLLGRRVDVRTSTEVQRVERRSSGDGVRLTVRDGEGSETVVEADLLLVATGRRPNADTDRKSVV